MPEILTELNQPLAGESAPIKDWEEAPIVQAEPHSSPTFKHDLASHEGKAEMNEETMAIAGIHSPAELKRFLASPEGKAEMNKIIEEELFEEQWWYEENLKNLIEQEEEDEFSFYHYLKKKLEELAKHRLELIALQIEKKELSHKKTIEPPHHAPPEKHEKTESLSNSMEALDMLLKGKLKQLEKTHQTFQELEKQKILMDGRHNIYNANLESAESLCADQADEPNEKEARIKRIQDRIELLSHKVAADAENVSLLLSEGQEEEARHLLDSSNGRHLQMQWLQEMLSVLRNEKHFLDEEGNRVSHKDAKFVLPIAKKLIPYKGTYCLLPATVGDFDSLSLEVKEAGVAAFKKDQNTLQPLNFLLQQNEAAETSRHEMQVSNVSAENETIKQEISSLYNQMNTLESRSSLEQTQTNSDTNQPNIQPLPNTPTPKPSTQSNQSKSITAKKPVQKPARVSSARQEIDYPEEIQDIVSRISRSFLPASAQFQALKWLLNRLTGSINGRFKTQIQAHGQLAERLESETNPLEAKAEPSDHTHDRHGPFNPLPRTLKVGH